MCVATFRLLLSVVYSTVAFAPAVGVPSILVFESITNRTWLAAEFDCCVVSVLALPVFRVSALSVTDTIVPLTDWLIACDCD